MSDAASPPARPMRYPYTLTAKFVQFPFKFHWNCNWYSRYYVYGMIPTFFIFCKIHAAVNSDANKERVRKEKEKEHREHLEHLKHLK